MDTDKDTAGMVLFRITKVTESSDDSFENYSIKYLILTHKKNPGIPSPIKGKLTLDYIIDVFKRKMLKHFPLFC